MEVIKTENAPAAIGPYSQAVRSNRFLFISGQLGILPESGQFAGEDFAAQARQAMKNISSIISAAGLSMQQAIKFEVFLTDMDNFSIFNAIYSDFMKKGCLPARQVIGVASLPKGALIELSCICEIID